MRADKPELNKKGSEANHYLKEMCNRKNFYLINHQKKKTTFTSLITAKKLKQVI